VISRVSVNLIMCTGIMCTGGAWRPFLQERHFSEASSFHIGVSRGRRMASSGRLARLAPDAGERAAALRWARD